MQNQSSEWCSSDVPLNDRTDAWQAVLSNSYREWQVPRRLPATFYANIKKHDFAGAGIVETVCDPCVGQRTGGQVRHDDELHVGVQLTTGGRERFKIGASGVEIVSGDLVVWTTDQVVEFEVVERLHKGTLLAVHLLALSHEIATLDESVQSPVSRSTLELLVIALSGQQPSQSFDASTGMRRRVQDYILLHLHGGGLSPARIAEAHHTSLRYLHTLFHQGDATVSGWVLDRRLHACKQALMDAVYDRQHISKIAFRWGFNSTSHFCRAFKQKYGASPGDVRRSADAHDELT